MEEKKQKSKEQDPSDNALSDQVSSLDSKKEGAVKKAHFSSLIPEKKESDPLAIDFLMDISLNLSIELGRTILNVKDILALREGAVVELDKLAGDPVDIFINNKLIARGEVVVIDDNFGVRVIDILSPTEIINNLKSDRDKK